MVRFFLNLVTDPAAVHTAPPSPAGGEEGERYTGTKYKNYQYHINHHAHKTMHTLKKQLHLVRYTGSVDKGSISNCGHERQGHKSQRPQRATRQRRKQSIQVRSSVKRASVLKPPHARTEGKEIYIAHQGTLHCTKLCCTAWK